MSVAMMRMSGATTVGAPRGPRCAMMVRRGAVAGRGTRAIGAGHMRVSIGARDHRGASLAVRAGNDDEDDLFSFLEAQMAEENGGADEEEAGSIPTANSIMGEEGSPMSGEELRLLVLNKWGKMYDTRIHQRRDQFNKLQLYLQIMWKHVGQKSFPLTETAYVEQLDAVAELLTEWGAQDVVRQKIPQSTKFPKMDTTGANAVMIPLEIEVDQ